MTTNNSLPQLSNSLPQLSETAKQKALELKARILAGEAVPLEELINFLQNADRVSIEARASRNAKIEKSETDIDFF